MASSGTNIHMTELTLFCKNLHESINALMHAAEGDCEKEVALTVYEEKCNRICKEVEDQSFSDLSTEDVYKYLQCIAQLVLDLTYVDECSLVEEEFPKSSAYARVHNIIDTLTSIEDIARKMYPTKAAKDILSPEIVECLYWRKGALLYMYCHSLNEEGMDEDPSENFQQCLENGVEFLSAMMSCRSVPKWLACLLPDSAACKEQDTDLDDEDEFSQLLSYGIYSDTHVLALMYCGEMCYWHTKSDLQTGKERKTKNDSLNSEEEVITNNSLKGNHASTSKMSCIKTGNTDFYTFTFGNKLDLFRFGHCALETYISVAKGPMKAGGWNTSRAEEILQFFNSIN